MRAVPMATRSPSRRFLSLTRSPLTREPFEELQSRRKYWLPRYSMTACRRDTMASGSTRSLEGSRPMDTSVRASGISRREEDVGFTISRATFRLSRAEGLPEVDADLHLRPLLHRGAVPPVAHGGEDGLVHDPSCRLHDLQ